MTTTLPLQPAAPARVAAFPNEFTLGHDGWAQLAPLGDFPGRARLTGPDGTVREFPALQRLDRAAAEGLVRRFKSPWARLRRFLTGCPIYVGHPDAPGAGREAPDPEAKGMIVDLAVRADGLYCRPVFTAAGSALVESRQLRALSGYWTAVPVPPAPGAPAPALPLYRPDVLQSAGLTNRPNLPVQLLNETAPEPPTESTMNKTLLIPLLALHGLTVAAEAPDAEFAAALQTLSDRAREGVAPANEKSATDARLQALTTAFTNERAARIAGLLEAALAAGRITVAERPDWERRLRDEAQFANESAALAALAPRLKTGSVVERDSGPRKVEMANAAERRETMRALVNVELAANGGNYDAAWEKVQRAHPALFEAMRQPRAN